MSKFIASWLVTAAEILEAEFGSSVDLLPAAATGIGAASFTLTAEIAGGWRGSFTATVEESALNALVGSGSAKPEGQASGPQVAESVRQEWQRLFRHICITAATDLSAKSGAACAVAMISPANNPVGTSATGYQLRVDAVMVALMLSDQVVHSDHVEMAGLDPAGLPVSGAAAPSASGDASVREAVESEAAVEAPRGEAQAIDIKGLELLLDVELEASLRFGSREMALSDLLALGPGDVIQLDRALADPVDLVIGDKIVARGEVVLVNGNFGLQIAEVAEPRKSLESIRCLF
jgi:flagellar motor switch protein FliN/FliY